LRQLLVPRPGFHLVPRPDFHPVPRTDFHPNWGFAEFLAVAPLRPTGTTDRMVGSTTAEALV
jgi:hypothetical protein